MQADVIHRVHVSHRAPEEPRAHWEVDGEVINLQQRERRADHHAADFQQAVRCVPPDRAGTLLQAAKA